MIIKEIIQINGDLLGIINPIERVAKLVNM